MKVLVSGASGLVGRFVVDGLRDAGHEVLAGSRRPSGDGGVEMHLDPDRDQRHAFAGVDAFVHAAFDHVPGRYRGGEGDDAEGFRRRNLDGTIRLFEDARATGVGKAVFLSTRAVYGTQPPGTELFETTEPQPDTLYGEVKLAAEDAVLALSGPAFVVAVLRVTGVYGGPPERNKWTPLVSAWLAGEAVEPRAGTEVHGRDVASAIALALKSRGGVFNVSDILVDTRDILHAASVATGISLPLPAAADSSSLNPMNSDRLRALGWRPGGRAPFRADVAALARALKS
jgi:nucleoside-diphosphate-sugar epimerase